MPTIDVDTEQAALIEAALVMMEAALSARIERRDPDNIISNSLLLQASKLASVRAMLAMPPPSSFDELPEPMQNQARRAAAELVDRSQAPSWNRAWETLRGLLNAADFPR